VEAVNLLCFFRVKMEDLILCFPPKQVLEPNWQKMEERLREAKSLEAVLGVHDDFLDSCLKESMLTHPKLLKVVSKILSLSELFCEYFEVSGRAGCG